MDEPGGHCAQRNEPATRGQMPQGSTQTFPGRVSSTERDRGVTVGTRGGKRGRESPCSMGTEFQYGTGTEIRRRTRTVCWSHATERPALHVTERGAATALRQACGRRINREQGQGTKQNGQKLTQPPSGSKWRFPAQGKRHTLSCKRPGTSL